MACYSPMNMLIKKKYQIIPCGKCIGCRLEKRRQWAVRATLEAKMHVENIFATLTYRDDALEIWNVHPTLVEEHLTKFWKRLRQELIRHPEKFTKDSEDELRYLASGEYGDESNRPHYHALIFGLDFKDKKIDRQTGDNYLYHSDYLDSIWTHGYCTIGSVSYSSASYVAKYAMKNDSHHKEIWNEIGVEPQFCRMSRRPALGLKWLEKHHADVYPSDELIINNQKMSSIKYFDNVYAAGNELLMQSIKQQRQKKAGEQSTSKKQLQIKQKVKLAQLKTGAGTKL